MYGYQLSMLVVLVAGGRGTEATVLLLLAFWVYDLAYMKFILLG